MTPVKFGISFTTTFFNQAGALVLVYRDGSVQVNHGGTEMGQGLHTKILQIAADGARPAGRRRSADADADRQGAEHVGDGGVERLGSERRGGAARVRDHPRAARRDRCRALRRRARPRSCSPAAGSIRAVSPSAASPFAEIVNQAYLAREPLFAAGYYRTPGLAFDWKTGQGTPFHYFAYGAAVSEVEVDGFTGQYRLLRTDILHDVGDSLSPLVDRGQVEGGFVQGVGWLTTEELVWSADGAFVSQRRVDLQAADARRVPARSARRVPRARRASPASSTAARRSASRR